MSSILVALLVLGAACWLWRDSLAARELAVQVCRRSCESEQVQFLDDTVALASVHPVFPRGRIALRRVYQFDFSRAGDDRQSGTIVLTGTRLETLYLPNQTAATDSQERARGIIINLVDRKNRH